MVESFLDFWFLRGGFGLPFLFLKKTLLTLFTIKLFLYMFVETKNK